MQTRKRPKIIISVLFIPQRIKRYPEFVAFCIGKQKISTSHGSEQEINAWRPISMHLLASYEKQSGAFKILEDDLNISDIVFTELRKM